MRKTFEKGKTSPTRSPGRPDPNRSHVYLFLRALPDGQDVGLAKTPEDQGAPDIAQFGPTLMRSTGPGC